MLRHHLGSSLVPGRYGQIRIMWGQPMHFPPGIFCFSSFDVSVLKNMLSACHTSFFVGAVQLFCGFMRLKSLRLGAFFAAEIAVPQGSHNAGGLTWPA